MGLNYIKGVNLGNWLVLEKWMNPALFDGTTATTNITCRRSSTRPSMRHASNASRRIHQRTRLRHHQIVGAELRASPCRTSSSATVHR